MTLHGKSFIAVFVILISARTGRDVEMCLFGLPTTIKQSNIVAEIVVSYFDRDFLPVVILLTTVKKSRDVGTCKPLQWRR